jgi:hypothetical protein
VTSGNGDVCHPKLISQLMAYVIIISIMGKMGMSGVCFFMTICHKLSGTGISINFLLSSNAGLYPES